MKDFANEKEREKKKRLIYDKDIEDDLRKRVKESGPWPEANLTALASISSGQTAAKESLKMFHLYITYVVSPIVSPFVADFVWEYSVASGWENDRWNVLAPRIPSITRLNQQVVVFRVDGLDLIFVDQYASPTDFSFP